MKRALRRLLLHLEVVEQVVDDLAIVESNFNELASTDRNDLVDVSFLSGIAIVDFGILRVAGPGTRYDLGPAQGRVVSVRAHEI